MRALRSIVSLVTALAFFLQMTGLAAAQEVQPVPYNPAQPIPAPGVPSYAPTPAPAPAPAVVPQGPGADTVYLRGGGMMRGTMIEMLPNDHVTLQLPTGQNAIIEWGKIDHIERSPVAQAYPPVVRVPPGPPAASVVPVAPPGPRYRPVQGAILLHVEADPGIVLEGLAPGTGRWQDICAAPCDRPVPLGMQYRVTGEGIRPSRAFGIEASPGQRVTLIVNAASRGAFAGGLALTSVGSLGVVVGAVLVLVGFAQVCSSTDSSGDCIGSAQSGLETAGVVVMLAGVAMLIGGIVLTTTNGRTKTTQLVGELFPKLPSRPETAWLRTPEWHDSPKDAPAGLPRMTGIPILSHAF